MVQKRQNYIEWMAQIIFSAERQVRRRAVVVCVVVVCVMVGVCRVCVVVVCVMVGVCRVCVAEVCVVCASCVRRGGVCRVCVAGTQKGSKPTPLL